MKQIIENFKKETGLNQSALAKAVGVTQPQMSEYENEKRQMTVNKIYEWCKKLNVEPKKILT